MKITNIDILYYEPRDYTRARGQFFDVQKWVEEHGQGYLGVYYPPFTEDYVRVCHFDSIDDLRQALTNVNFRYTIAFDPVARIPEIIYSALNADIDRTKILGCRTVESKRAEGKRLGIRSMSVNDVIAMTVDGVRRCVIVRDIGFGDLPAGWETAPMDTSKPLPRAIVGQCQDVSHRDRGDEAWRKYVYGSVTKYWPGELLVYMTGHESPYSKDEMAAAWSFVMNGLSANACVDGDIQKDIKKYLYDIQNV